MKIDVRPRKRNSPRPAEKSAPGYLQWLRGRPCMIGGLECSGERIEAAHVDYAGDKGMGTKVSDKHAVPLCSRHHHQQHSIGWQSFERMHNITALSAAVVYWNAWPGRRAWEDKFK